MQRTWDEDWCGGGKANMLVDDTMSEQIKIQLPDGSVREVARGTTALDVAMSISPRLAAAVVVARIRPLTPVAGGRDCRFGGGLRGCDVWRGGDVGSGWSIWRRR